MSQAPAQRGSASARGSFVVSPPHEGEDLKLNLSDIPLIRDDDMEVEGLKPSFLSRLLDLVTPGSRR